MAGHAKTSPSKLSHIAETALKRDTSLSRLEGKDFRSLSRQDCQAFVDFLSKDLAQNTVRKKFGFLKNFLDEAVDMDVLAENPATRV